jgi:uncharacterized ubiquitin-like protein YukD
MAVFRFIIDEYLNLNKMSNDCIIEISEFTLSYNGMYNVEFEYEDRNYFFPIYLPIDRLLKIIENEKLSLEDLEKTSIHICKKSTLQFKVFNDESNNLRFYNHPETEYWQSEGLFLRDVQLKEI